MKTRVTEEDELEGLDTAIHGESAYDWGGIGTSGHLGTATAVTTSKESVTA